MELKLSKKQTQAWMLLSPNSSNKLLLYGGAAGGGKTWLGCLWQIYNRIKYPNTRGFIGRNGLQDLKGTTLKTFAEVAKLIDVKYKINHQSQEIKFENGSEIVFRDLRKNPSDPLFERIGGLEITDFFIDEASEVSKTAIDVITSRIRYRNAELNIPPKGLLTCNPSKSWLYTSFWKPYKKNIQNGSKFPFFINNELAFIQAMVSDNPDVEFAKEYEKNLNSLTGIQRQRLLLGDWDYSDDELQLISMDDLTNFFTNSAPMLNNISPNNIYLTCDVARFGSDKTVIIHWVNYHIENIYTFSKQDLNSTAQFIKELKDRLRIGSRNIVIDSDGVGGGVVDLIKGCRSFVANSKPYTLLGRKENYANLKSQCTYTMAEAFSNNKLSINESVLSKTIDGITYQELIQEELLFIKRDKVDADGKLFIEPKDQIKKALGRSPDFADALMMRFTPVLKIGTTKPV